MGLSVDASSSALSTRDALRSAFGGPNALTPWSLIVAFPVGLLSGFLFGVRYGVGSPTWFATMLAIQLPLVLPYLLLRRGLIRASERRPRPGLGLAAFGLLGGLRVVGLVVAARAQGAPLPPEFVLEYLPHGIASGIVVLGIVAVVVDGSRTHADTMRQLAALDAGFERLRSLDEATIERAEAEAADAVRRSLDNEIAALRRSPDVTAAAAAASLRRLAEDSVRSTSHRLVDEDPVLPAATEEAGAIDRGGAARMVLALVRPAAPTIPVVLVLLMGMPAEAAERVGGVVFAVLNLLLGGAVMWTVLWALAHAWPPGPTTVRRLVVIAAVSAFAGVSAAFVMACTSLVFAGVFRGLWVGALLFPVLAVGVSVLTAIGERRQLIEEHLAASVVRDAEITMQVRDRARRARRRVAEFLHSGVQSELIASSLALAQLPQEHAEASERDARVVAELDRLAATISRAPRAQEDVADARLEIAELVGLWSGVLDVTLDVADDTWRVLDRDGTARIAVEYVVSEGLTNAVRHAGTRRASVAMVTARDAVVVRIVSVGSVKPTARAGLGSRFLDEHARSWQLTEHDGLVELFAAIPHAVDLT